jgi:hypothetical protein
MAQLQWRGSVKRSSMAAPSMRYARTSPPPTLHY